MDFEHEASYRLIFSECVLQELCLKRDEDHQEWGSMSRTKRLGSLIRVEKGNLERCDSRPQNLMCPWEERARVHRAAAEGRAETSREQSGAVCETHTL